MDPPLHSRVKSAISWVDSSRLKPTKVTNVSSQGLVSIFWDVWGILFIDYLEKGRTINSKYYIAQIKKKCSLTKTLHSITSRSQWWQNYMNCTSNCFCTHPILQIWPPVTTGCLQTSKDCCRERDLAPMKKWY